MFGYSGSKEVISQSRQNCSHAVKKGLDLKQIILKNFQQAMLEAVFLFFKSLISFMMPEGFPQVGVNTAGFPIILGLENLQNCELVFKS